MPPADATCRSMKTVDLAEAQSRLAELIDKLVPGEEVIMALHQKPVARLTAAQPPGKAKRQFGSAKGKVIFHAGWDEPCNCRTLTLGTSIV
jgi:antitoxin (DNA-binding transcriptional repressor) of toxin-antitoxin stability system